tara:strand:+ start:599 stop:916 length:318 start_codon:yes stop_codon:yes gene_type:complete
MDDEHLSFQEIIIKNIKHIEDEYLKGICLNDIFYNIGIPKRKEFMQTKINKLFMLINDNKLKDAKESLNKLRAILGESDGELHQAKTEIQLSESFDADFNNEFFK